MTKIANDRTIYRHAEQPKSNIDQAFMLWLRNQKHMLTAWENELISAQSNDITVFSLQGHRDWLDNVIAHYQSVMEV